MKPGRNVDQHAGAVELRKGSRTTPVPGRRVADEPYTDEIADALDQLRDAEGFEHLRPRRLLRTAGTVCASCHAREDEVCRAGCTAHDEMWD